jgi:hypothetical protein
MEDSLLGCHGKRAPRLFAQRQARSPSAMTGKVPVFRLSNALLNREGLICSLDVARSRKPDEIRCHNTREFFRSGFS